MSEKKTRVVVAMSGGVDSSVAAHLLVEQGYEVVGISMRLWSYEGEAKHGCCTPEDLYDARRVADQLGIPHYVSNFEPTFEKTVISQFIESYKRGETPNPCARCNQDVKFAALLTRAKELGAEYLATGHYARKKRDGGRYRLLRAVDRQKDQSYFLFGMTQEELGHLMFPLGDLTKDEVRKVAQKAGLDVAEKEESQEICFVADDYASFVRARLKGDEVVEGKIVDEAGKPLASHDGIHQFTIGQRRGLGLNTMSPHYVLDIEKSGKVVVGPDASLFKKSFDVRGPIWISSPPKKGEAVEAQIRSRFSASPARIEAVDASNVKVRFETPQRAITPGQAAVFYRGDEVIGGGWISRP